MKAKGEDHNRKLIETLFYASIKSEKSKIKIEKLIGDAGMRKYFRILGSKKNYIACLNEANNNQVAKFAEIQKIFQDHSINVPDIYDCHLDKDYILQEDLGDQSLLQVLGTCKTLERERDLYETAICQMMQIQKLVLDNHDLEKAFSRLAFDTKKFMQEIEFSIQYFIKWFLKHKLTKSEEQILKDHFLGISQKLAASPRVLCHRDYHSRNIVVKEEKQYVIDFQDARLGIPQYDLVSLLEDCYYSVNQSNKSYLKELYWNQFIKHYKLQSSLEEFNLLYDLAAIQRIFKAIGSFTYIFQKKEDFRYLKYVGYAFENLRKILSVHPQLEDLKVVLGNIYYGR